MLLLKSEVVDDDYYCLIGASQALLSDEYYLVFAGSVEMSINKIWEFTGLHWLIWKLIEDLNNKYCLGHKLHFSLFLATSALFCHIKLNLVLILISSSSNSNAIIDIPKLWLFDQLILWQHRAVTGGNLKDISMKNISQHIFDSSHRWKLRSDCGRLMFCDISCEQCPRPGVTCHQMLTADIYPRDAMRYLRHDNVTVVTIKYYSCLTSDPVIVTHESEETLTTAHVPHSDALVSAATGQEWSRIGATRMRIQSTLFQK